MAARQHKKKTLTGGKLLAEKIFEWTQVNADLRRACEETDLQGSRLVRTKISHRESARTPVTVLSEFQATSKMRTLSKVSKNQSDEIFKLAWDIAHKSVAAANNRDIAAKAGSPYNIVKAAVAAVRLSNPAIRQRELRSAVKAWFTRRRIKIPSETTLSEHLRALRDEMQEV